MKARFEQCAQEGKLMDNMNVWNGIKKRQNVGPKKKRSSSEDDSDSSDVDPVIRVQP
jgi:hypothetical protein